MLKKQKRKTNEAFLLDLNLLIALAWPTHVHHQNAHKWFSKNSSKGWATCPFTQCGFVRVCSNPNFSNQPVTPQQTLELLKRITSSRHHIFWKDSIPLHSSYIPTEFLLGHRQVTDAYLLGLAVHNKGKLATFDRKIPSLLPKNSPHQKAIELINAKF